MNTPATGNHEPLPRPAVNLARRAAQLARQGDGRHHLELIVINGRLVLIVDNGKPEDLGELTGPN